MNNFGIMLQPTANSRYDVDSRVPKVLKHLQRKQTYINDVEDLQKHDRISGHDVIGLQLLLGMLRAARPWT
jgi:hypothetical protein